jgi:hypothetical protein
MSDASDERRTLRVISGSPSPEELAAVLAIVTARSGTAQPPAERVRRGNWSDPAAQHRRPLLPGPNGWRASAW